MSQSPLALAGGFPTPDQAQWRALVDKALKGASFEALTGRSADGLPLKPVYTAADWSGGAAPLLPPSDALKPWDIRQIVHLADPAAANAEILSDLEGGVTSIELAIGADASKIGDALAGMMVDLAPVALSGGGIAAAEALADFVRKRGWRDAALAFNLDPFGAAMRAGRFDPKALDEALAFAKSAAGEFPNAALFRVDCRPAHEAGGSEAQELAILLAAGAAWLRAGEAAGTAPEALAPRLSPTLSVGADIQIEIPKLRAARLLWSRLLEACGVPAAPARLQAVTSSRMMARRDPWVNMMRVTAAGFAAAAGGADIVTTLPLTEALGQPNSMARRIARNTQLILAEESHIGAAADPAGGAWAFETLTLQLAETAWALFQKIEAAGGLVAALEAGLPQTWIAATRDAHIQSIRKRKSFVTGVSDFPLLDETSIEAAPWPKPVAAAEPTFAPLSPVRWAETFERLRDVAEKAGAPKVFLANLGPLAQFSARAMFSKAFFEAGGLAAPNADVEYSDEAALVAAFKAGGVKLACLCGSDKVYAEKAEAAVKALKAAGAVVWLAGKPGELESGLRAAGLSDFIAAGADAVTSLEKAHAIVGIVS